MKKMKRWAKILFFISRDEFTNFRQLHSILQGHPDCKKVPGVDASTGSLGQGCSIAVGMALGAKQLKKDTKVYTILGCIVLALVVLVGAYVTYVFIDYHRIGDMDLTPEGDAAVTELAAG